ncbi:MAG: hypothetical protein ABEI32_06245, partial [Halothece sp.]
IADARSGVADIGMASRSLSQGKFPLTRPLNLVTKGKPTGLSKDFIEFAQSSQVHDTIKNQYFSPVSQ